MKDRITLLVTPAGRRCRLLECFRADAGTLGIGLTIIAGDLNPNLSAACQIADRAVEVRATDEADFLAHMIDVCRREKVDLLVPLLDRELPVFAKARNEFSAIGTDVAISDTGLVDCFQDKLDTAAFLADGGIPVPRTAALVEFGQNGDSWGFPIVVKPRVGAGSRGVVIINDRAELDRITERDLVVVQTYWAGSEYTVNVYFDRDGRLRCAIPHRRDEVRDGEVSKGITCRHPVLESIAKQFGELVHGKVRGPLCFQAIVGSDGKAAVFDVNARFGGGYPLAHAAGACFTRWLLEETSGRTLSAGNEWREGVRMLAYPSAVFLDE